MTTTPTLRQAERALTRAYLATRGRGKQWRRIYRAIDRIVSAAMARGPGQAVRALAYGSAFGHFVLGDIVSRAPGTVEGFTATLRILVRT